MSWEEKKQGKEGIRDKQMSRCRENLLLGEKLEEKEKISEKCINKWGGELKSK